MLPIASHGFNRSVKEHNVDLLTVCDWIEGSVVFRDGDLSLSDIADVLLEEDVYENQDLAAELVADCWVELQRRIRCAGPACAYQAQGDKRFVSRGNWQNAPAYCFCLLLSLAPKYDWWKSALGQDYTVQGDLFEQLTECSLRTQFPGWETYRTGWAKGHTENLRALALSIASRLYGDLGEIALWEKGGAKDLGADILGYRPFSDSGPGIMSFLVQCASGGNWHSKRSQPDLKEWASLIRVPTLPSKAFAVPFILDEGEFRRCCISVGGMLLDRNRLLMAAHHSPDWLPVGLAGEITEWCRPRIDAMVERCK